MQVGFIVYKNECHHLRTVSVLVGATQEGEFLLLELNGTVVDNSGLHCDCDNFPGSKIPPLFLVEIRE